MRTETAAQVFWNASLAWKRTPGYVEGVTVDKLFKTLEPLYTHPSFHLSRQANALSDMIVHGRIRRKADKRTRNNVVLLRPVIVGEPGQLFASIA